MMQRKFETTSPNGNTVTLDPTEVAAVCKLSDNETHVYLRGGSVLNVKATHDEVMAAVEADNA